ncbi:hypothetical protein ACFLT2_11690 [Acidobacteriota bacterium]
MRIRAVSAVIVPFLLVIVLVSCGKKSEEDVILDLMEDVAEYVENKDIENLLMHFAEDYEDFQGRSKSQTRAMITQYFQDFQGIVSHVLSTQIEEVTPIEASIQTDVLVSSGGAKLFRKFVKYAGDCYRIKAKLVNREGLWQLQYAEWSYISLTDLFPESVSILRKIFPNL